MKNSQRLIITFICSLLLSCHSQKEEGYTVQQSFFEKIYKKNTSFFNELLVLKNFEKKEDVELKITYILNAYNKDKMYSRPKKVKEILNKQRKSILKEYFISIEKEPNINTFTKGFLVYVENLSIDIEDKEFCLKSIDFYNKLMNYIKTTGSKQNNLNISYRFPPCARRGCFDCCMYRKAQELEQSNWVDKAYFLSSAAYNVAAWAASCTWTCNSSGGGGGEEGLH